jgi:hypothetical protein
MRPSAPQNSTGQTDPQSPAIGDRGDPAPAEASPAIAYSLLVALLLSALAYWAPWVDHNTSALKLGGQDLGEFVKFIPEIRTGQVSFPRQLFYLPPLACVACLTLASVNRRLPYARWVRVSTLILALFLLPGLLPPVWGHPRDLFTTEFRLQGIAFLLGVLLILAHGTFRNLSLPVLTWAVGILAAIALVSSGSAFFAIWPRVRDIYGTPTARLGWGLWLNITAWTGVLVSALLLSHESRSR